MVILQTQLLFKPEDSPAVIRRMARSNGDEGAAASGRDLVMGDQFTFHNRAIVFHFHDAGHQAQRLVRWRRTPQLDCVVGRYGAGRMIKTVSLHQEVRRGPVAVTIEQCPDNAAAEHASECFLISLRLKFGRHLVAVGKAADVQTLFVGRTTTKAGVVGSVSFLETLVHFEICGRLLVLPVMANAACEWSAHPLH